MLLSDQLGCWRKQCNKSRISVCICRAQQTHGASTAAAPTVSQPSTGCMPLCMHTQIMRVCRHIPCPQVWLQLWPPNVSGAHTALSSCWQCQQSPHCHFPSGCTSGLPKIRSRKYKADKISQVQIGH